MSGRISEINPLDAEALRLGKDASARASMASGGWTQAASYRDVLKDKEMAVSLEQQSRMKLSDESLDQQIAETYAAHQAQPENVDLARRLGALNEQKNDFESAISWYQYAADLTKGTDAGLVRRVSDLRMKSFEREIAEPVLDIDFEHRLQSPERRRPKRLASRSAASSAIYDSAIETRVSLNAPTSPPGVGQTGSGPSQPIRPALTFSRG